MSWRPVSLCVYVCIYTKHVKKYLFLKSHQDLIKRLLPVLPEINGPSLGKKKKKIYNYTTTFFFIALFNLITLFPSHHDLKLSMDDAFLPEKHVNLESDHLGIDPG